jgi:HEAT repeat protein
MTRRTFVDLSLGAAVASSALTADESDKLQFTSPAPTSREACWNTLHRYSQDGSSKKRQFAAAAISLIAEYHKPALEMATAILASDRDAEVRTFMAASLGEDKVRAAIPSLRRALDDSTAAVVFAAAKALWDMDDRSGSVVFREVLLGERKEGTSLINGALAEARHKLHNPKGLAMMGIKEATGAFFGPGAMAISFAQEELKDKGAPSRAFSASALANDHSRASREALEAGLQDSSPLVRAACCKSLALRRVRGALPYIEPLVDDKDHVVQCMAAGAIIRLRR